MAVWLLPVSPVWATNESRPRTPAGFVVEGCLQDIDRSGAPAALTVDLAIPFEDDATTPDELPDSRTFQFFATCRDLVPGETMPNWITIGDAERAMTAGSLDTLPSSAEVLDQGAWSMTPGHDGVGGSCVQSITQLDERIAITCEATLPGVTWTPSAVPVGAYVIHGYTFEPNNNLWHRRPGVVRVHDGDPAMAGPAAALVTPGKDGRAHQGSPYELQGCAAGPPGTTVTVQWAPTTASDLSIDAAWTDVGDVAINDPVAGQDFTIDFDPPTAAVGQAVLFRVVAEADDGTRFIHHTDAFLIVLDPPGESDAPTRGTPPDACRDTPGTSSGTSGDDTGAGDTTGGLERDTDGCACTAGDGDRRGTVAWLVILSGLLATRRRRRPSTD